MLFTKKSSVYAAFLQVVQPGGICATSCCAIEWQSRNHILKKSTHEPTIGLLICKTKDNTMVKWALESSPPPIGVSEFKIQEILPKEIESDLPSIAEIESEIERNVM